MRYYSILLVFILFSCSDDFTVPSHVPGVVKVSGNHLFTSYGDGGLIVTSLNTDEVTTHIFPAGDMRGIDDFDIAGDLLFVLDARGNNYVASYSIADLDNPELIDGPYLVPGEPFNGISARNGNLVVSGGTRHLEYFQYDASGEISGPATFGRDRGHPDVLLSDNGQVAFASTDFNLDRKVNGARFGILALSLGTELQIPTEIDQIGITEAGITDGVTTPVGFPIQTALYNNRLLVAHGGGLTIIDLVEQSAFGASRLLDLGINAISVQAQNDIAYVIGLDPTLVKVDISDPANPSIIESVPLNIGDNIPTSLALSNTSVFIAAGEAGLLELAL